MNRIEGLALVLFCMLYFSTWCITVDKVQNKVLKTMILLFITVLPIGLAYGAKMIGLIRN